MLKWKGRLVARQGLPRPLGPSSLPLPTQDSTQQDQDAVLGWVRGSPVILPSIHNMNGQKDCSWDMVSKGANTACVIDSYSLVVNCKEA